MNDMKILGNAIKTAALIIALAMLACSIVDYYTFKEPSPEEDTAPIEIPI